MLWAWSAQLLWASNLVFLTLLFPSSSPTYPSVLPSIHLLHPKQLLFSTYWALYLPTHLPIYLPSSLSAVIYPVSYPHDSLFSKADNKHWSDMKCEYLKQCLNLRAKQLTLVFLFKTCLLKPNHRETDRYSVQVYKQKDAEKIFFKIR